MTKLLTRPAIGQAGALWRSLRELVDRFHQTSGHTHAGQAGEGPTLANAAIALTWTTWTPTVTQSGAVTLTVVYAQYCKVGKQATVEVQLLVTGSGTVANAVVIGGQPAALASARTGTYAKIGGAFVLDASDGATSHHSAELIAVGTTDWRLLEHASNNYWGVSPAIGLAVDDRISLVATYETT